MLKLLLTTIMAMMIMLLALMARTMLKQRPLQRGPAFGNGRVRVVPMAILRPNALGQQILLQCLHLHSHLHP